MGFWHIGLGFLLRRGALMIGPPRFSADDIADIINATGLRSAVLRDNGPGHDRIDVMISHRPDCSFRFELDAVGHVYLLHASPCELKLLMSGTLTECLSMFAPRSAS